MQHFLMCVALKYIKKKIYIFVIVIPPVHRPQEESQPWTSVVIGCRRVFVPCKQMGWGTWLSIISHGNFFYWKIFVCLFFCKRRSSSLANKRRPGGAWDAALLVTSQWLWGRSVLQSRGALSSSLTAVQQHTLCFAKCFGLPCNARHNMKARLNFIQHV